MSDGLPIDTANLMGLSLGMMLYGLFLSLWFSVIGPLWHHRRPSPFVFWAMIIVFCATTFDVGMFLADAYNGFIGHAHDIGTTEYYVSRSSLFFGLQSLGYTISGLTVDMLLCWRLYIIWGKNMYILILPLIFLLLETACALLLVSVSFLHYSLFGAHSEYIRSFATVTAAAAVVVNGFCSSMIIGRLWWVRRTVSDPRARSTYQTIIVSLIESGSLNTVGIVVFTVIVLLPNLEGVYMFVEYPYILIPGFTSTLIIHHLNKASGAFNDSTIYDSQTPRNRSSLATGTAIRFKTMPSYSPGTTTFGVGSTSRGVTTSFAISGVLTEETAADSWKNEDLERDAAGIRLEDLESLSPLPSPTFARDVPLADPTEPGEAEFVDVNPSDGHSVEGYKG